MNSKSQDSSSADSVRLPPGEPPHPGMVWIPGGTFKMGSDKHYPEEAPVHSASVDGFWMDKFQVTNAQFAMFVRETGYVTLAERPPDPELYPDAPAENLVPGSLVFKMTKGPVNLRFVDQWWDWMPGACWKRPGGPGTHVRKKQRHPVVQIAYEDALAYSQWAGKELPSEAEWEFAARGGVEGAEFTWGDEHTPDGKFMANSWQGEFPWQNQVSDGFEGTAPVGSFPPNPYDLHDMAGNAWDWTADWWSESHPQDPDKPCCIPNNPRGGQMEKSYDPVAPQWRIPRRVVKGGSYLCAPNYCLRYRPAARRPQMIDTGMSHVSFRCVVRMTAAASSG